MSGDVVKRAVAFGSGNVNEDRILSWLAGLVRNLRKSPQVELGSAGVLCVSIESGTVEKVVKKDQYFNRIHVEDIVGAVGLALESPLLQGVYNLSDDMPSSGDVVIDEATRILGLPKIKETLFENATLSEMAKSFYEDSKKVSNRKLRQILGYSLKYPTYKSGLVSIFDSTKD